jgi:hypothetical protein
MVHGCEANRNHDSRLPERAVKIICEEDQHHKGSSFMDKPKKIGAASWMAGRLL